MCKSKEKKVFVKNVFVLQIVPRELLQTFYLLFPSLQAPAVININATEPKKIWFAYDISVMRMSTGSGHDRLRDSCSLYPKVFGLCVMILYHTHSREAISIMFYKYLCELMDHN